MAFGSQTVYSQQTAYADPCTSYQQQQPALNPRVSQFSHSNTWLAPNLLMRMLTVELTVFKQLIALLQGEFPEILELHWIRGITGHTVLDIVFV